MSETPWPIEDPQQHAEAMTDLAQRLFPIHRTLVNKGYDQSLELIRSELELDVLQYPSGKQVWDWQIPNAWDVNKAYVEDSGGHRLVDFADNNLHLSAYSVPFSGEVTRDELFEHLQWIEAMPDAIPYGYLYYQRAWQFNIAHQELSRFTDDRYRVHIDVTEEPGHLKVGCCHLPGESRQEIVFSTYLCHPSLANDNLSGVVAAVELFKLLSHMPQRRYSYRLIIVPETIGAIAWLAHHEDLFDRIAGAFVVYDCGDAGPVTYKRSYFGDALVDRVAQHVLRHYCDHARIREWYPGGSDERQFSAPGVRIPAGALTRTPAGEFREYHTSLDTLDLLQPDALLDTLRTLYGLVQVLEHDMTYVNQYRGEPCVSRHAISYPQQRTDEPDGSKYLVKKCMHEFDGAQTLLQIAEKCKVSIGEVETIARQFLQAGLIAPAENHG